MTKEIKYYIKDAKDANIQPDKTGHMPSRISSGENRGLYLKKVTHPTFHKSVQADLKKGYKLYKKGSRYYSFKDKEDYKEDSRWVNRPQQNWNVVD